MTTGVKAPPTTDESPPPSKYVVRAVESEGASISVQKCDTDKELWRLLDFLITERKSFKVEVERS